MAQQRGPQRARALGWSAPRLCTDYNPTFMSSGRTLTLLSLAELLAMSLWFAGTAVLPQLANEWHAGLALTSWLTLAVQLGFVTGALLSATLNLADVFSAPRVFVISSLLAAFANAMFGATAARSITAAIVLRFLTGAFLAGVYPTGMKILAGWYRQGRGLALGVLVGALTVGSAVPHGLSALGALREGSWQLVIYLASAQAALAAVIVAVFVKDGPYAAPSPPFDFTQIAQVLSVRKLRLANFGYFGHMWELYSMWGWIAVLLAASSRGTVPVLSDAVMRGIAFLAIAVGGIGCVWAGRVADRTVSGGADASSVLHESTRQRARVTIYAMAVSGVCCLLAALFFPNTPVLIAISIVWGISVVADSAQFSAIVSELSDPRYVGTALTLQTALGFLLTVVSIRTTAWVADNYGWPLACAQLALGPLFGIVSMLRLMKEQN